jgi:hypothetical protein
MKKALKEIEEPRKYYLPRRTARPTEANPLFERL